MSDALRVVLVDDDINVLKTLRTVFESAGFEVLVYDNAERFLDAVPASDNTAVVLDLRMPRTSGFEVLSELRRRKSSLPVIVYSSHADVEATVKVFEDGAYTLVQKPASKSLLIEKVRQAIRQSRKSGQRVALSIEATRRINRLSPRESQIAELISSGKSAREIGERVHLSPRTVETHRNNIFSKTGVTSSAELSRLMTLSELYSSDA